MTQEEFKNRKASVKAAFEARGESFAEFARRRGYKLRTVYAVLNGQKKCLRGVTHKIAVEIGLKPKPELRKAA